MDLTSLTHALDNLRAAGHRLIARFAARHQAPSTACPLPRAPAENPAAVEHRVARALHWLAALGSILAGERTYHRPAQFVPPDNLAFLFVAVPRPARARPAVTEAARAKSRAAARLAYVRRIFATVPTTTLAIRLARRLGLAPTDEAWPHALVAIADPPAVWAARVHPAAVRVHPVRAAHAVLRAAKAYEKIWALKLAALTPHPRK